MSKEILNALICGAVRLQGKISILELQRFLLEGCNNISINFDNENAELNITANIKPQVRYITMSYEYGKPTISEE